MYFVQVKRKREVNIHQALQILCLWIINFSMGSGMGGLSDPEEGDFDIQNLFVDQGENVENCGDSGRHTLEETKGTYDCNNPLMNADDFVMTASVDEGALSQQRLLNDQREVNRVKKSTDLVVDIGLGPLVGLGDGPNLPSVVLGCGSDPI